MNLGLKKDGHIDSLTGLRAIAAGMVVLHHLVPIESPILAELNVGVTVFFVLSGFLITYRYYDLITKSKNWFFQYALNRIARIYPMYFLLTTVTFFFAFLGKHEFSIEILKVYLLNITFLRGFFGDYVYSGIAQGWTLTVEECFYFSAPLLILLSKRINVFIQALMIFCSGYIVYLLFRNINFHGFMNSLPVIYITSYFGRVFEFSIGVGTALLIMRGRVISHATRKGWIGFLMVLSIQIAINWYTQAFSIQSIFGYFINVLVLPIAVGIFIYGLTKEKSLIKSLLSKPFMILLGKSSYTLYLLHWGITGYLIRRFISSNFIIEILLTYIASICLWYLIEEPANKLIKQLGNAKESFRYVSDAKEIES